MSLFLKIINLFLGLFFNFLSTCKTNEMGADCSHESFKQLREAIANQCGIGEAYWEAHPTIKFIEYHPKLVEEMSFKQRYKKPFNSDGNDITIFHLSISTKLKSNSNVSYLSYFFCGE